MSTQSLDAYAPLLIHIIVALALAGLICGLSSLVGRGRRTRAKAQPYECGMRPEGDARAPFSVKFYLVAMVFILFDVEAIFLYPWALIYKSMAPGPERIFGFLEMLLYIGIVLVGYIYLWKKGALDWNN
ncbi:MAG: NADH-quinone oxidoreductase subunit A [Acidobacteria bacterium]|nr:NADH-quinone oxidoreductase subunit A [Acidobacteriota bacterium]